MCKQNCNTFHLVYLQNYDSPILGISIPSNGKFLMTCSQNGTMCIWDLKGSLQTAQEVSAGNHIRSCALSLCGHFFAIVEGSGEVRFWEVTYGPEKNFSGLALSQFKFSQHVKGALSLDFSIESDNLIILDKNSWKIFHLNGNYIKHNFQFFFILRVVSCEYIFRQFVF